MTAQEQADAFASEPERWIATDGDTITSRVVATHTLKTLAPWFEAVRRGEKTCEVRINDRDFKAGDWLRLVEWHPSNDVAIGGRETGRECFVRVTHIVEGGKFGIDRHHVVMSVRLE